MTARDEILGSIRRGLGRDALIGHRAEAVAARITEHPRNLIPARATVLDRIGRIELFVEMAQAVQTTVARLTADEDIPAEVVRYLATENLPAELVMAPDPSLEMLPWGERPLLDIRRGRAEREDVASLSPCLAAIAETGTLMLISGETTPTTLNFLPETHIIVVRVGQVVASYEDGWDLLRQRGRLPRTVNLITGPSRTGDIEQKIEIGAHGPRRLHVILVGNVAA